MTADALRRPRTPEQIRASNRRDDRQRVLAPLYERMRLANPVAAVGIAIHARRRGNQTMRGDLEADMDWIEVRFRVRRAGRIGLRHLGPLIDHWRANGMKPDRIKRRVRSLKWFFMVMGRVGVIVELMRPRRVLLPLVTNATWVPAPAEAAKGA